MKRKGFCDSPSANGRSPSAGFSLIEMSITLALLAAAFWLSTPSLQQLTVPTQASEITSIESNSHSDSEVYGSQGSVLTDRCEAAVGERCDPLDGADPLKHEVAEIVPEK